MWSRRGGSAQTSSEVLVVSVEGMHCGSCGLRIDDAVEDLTGVTRSTTSFRTGLTEVVLADGADPATVAPGVVAAITSAGYTAALRRAGP